VPGALEQSLTFGVTTVLDHQITITVRGPKNSNRRNRHMVSFSREIVSPDQRGWCQRIASLSISRTAQIGLLCLGLRKPGRWRAAQDSTAASCCPTCLFT
jgi:hypothetical protein